MKNIFVILLLIIFPFSAFAADGETVEYFGALWDFIDWIYEAFDEFTQTLMDYLTELSKVIILWYFEYKLDTVKFVWTYIEPIIDNLNLTDIVSVAFSGLSSDIQMIVSKFRIGESVNLLISASITRSVLRFIGW